MLEKEIQNTVCEYLQLRSNQGKLMFWRQNTAPTVQKNGDQWAFRSMPKFALKGIADIIVIRDGFAIFLEIKRKGSRQNPDQVAFEELCKKNGAEYYVIRSLEEVQAIGL